MINFKKLKSILTRKHSSRMRTTRLPTICALVATRCQYWWGMGPQANKFEQVSQMSLAGDGGQVSPLSDVPWGLGGLMSGREGGLMSREGWGPVQ